MAWHKTNPVSQRLATIPGIGPIIATAIAAMVAAPSGFRSGREFAAWLGLVPRQNSTGGKNRIGGISKRGNQYLRRLLINGASANLLRSKATNADPWVIGLRRRRPSLVVAVALANKTARIVWAVMHRQKELPAHGHGGLGCQASSGACERAMTRDGTVGRSDATERNLALRWDVDPNIADGRPGRRPVWTRQVLEGTLWILNTGAQWHMLPQCYPNYKTVHRRFQTWCRSEVLRGILMDIANELRERGVLDEEECFIDATFVMAKGGGAEVGPTKRGKGMKIMAIVDRHGLPLSVSTHAANHHEVCLVQLCFDFYMIEAKPENLIGDRAYDSDPLDHAIEMIAPHRSNRTKPPTQDLRRLRRFLRRWLVERFFAWIQWQRRLLVRWEYHPENFLGFVQLACLVVLFRRF